MPVTSTASQINATNFSVVSSIASLRRPAASSLAEEAQETNPERGVPGDSLDLAALPDDSSKRPSAWLQRESCLRASL